MAGRPHCITHKFKALEGPGTSMCGELSTSNEPVSAETTSSELSTTRQQSLCLSTHQWFSTISDINAAELCHNMNVSFYLQSNIWTHRT